MAKPLVGIIMGSDSDLPVMQEAAKVLEEFAVPYELTVVSAHRTPQRLYDYGKKAAGRGLRVVIAGAGGAAHLPGMIASLSSLPVIGVPIRTTNAAGIDSLFSIAQMPPGVPVATVAVNGAKNAGFLAVQVLGAGTSVGDKKLQKKMAAYKAKLGRSVLGKARKLEKDGFTKYLKEQGFRK